MSECCAGHTAQVEEKEKRKEKRKRRKRETGKELKEDRDVEKRREVDLQLANRS